VWPGYSARNVAGTLRVPGLRHTECAGYLRHRAPLISGDTPSGVKESSKLK
jgi:hypothetical protein